MPPPPDPGRTALLLPCPSNAHGRPSGWAGQRGRCGEASLWAGVQGLTSLRGEGPDAWGPRGGVPLCEHTICRGCPAAGAGLTLPRRRGTRSQGATQRPRTEPPDGPRTPAPGPPPRRRVTPPRRVASAAPTRSARPCPRSLPAIGPRRGRGLGLSQRAAATQVPSAEPGAGAYKRGPRRGARPRDADSRCGACGRLGRRRPGPSECGRRSPRRSRHGGRARARARHAAGEEPQPAPPRPGAERRPRLERGPPQGAPEPGLPRAPGEPPARPPGPPSSPGTASPFSSLPGLGGSPPPRAGVSPACPTSGGTPLPARRLSLPGPGPPSPRLPDGLPPPSALLRAPVPTAVALPPPPTPAQIWV